MFAFTPQLLAMILVVPECMCGVPLMPPGGGNPPTEYLTFAKDVKVRLIEPVAPETTPTHIEIKAQYYLMQSYCDKVTYGTRGIVPTRTFQGVLDATGTPLLTLTREVLGPLPQTIGTPLEVTAEKSQELLVLYSHTDNTTPGPGQPPTNWKEEHTIDPWCDAPQVSFSKYPVVDRTYEVETNKLLTVQFRFELEYQVPAPTYGIPPYNIDDQFRFKVTGLVSSGYEPLVRFVVVENPWRRGATSFTDTRVVEYPVQQNSAAFSYNVVRQVKRSGQENWETEPSAPGAGNGVIINVSTLPTPCKVTN